MRCSKCGAENPDRAKFCVECASPFARLCPSCNAENPPNAKFCLECGATLNPLTDAAVTEASPSKAASVVGERRHLTVLFSDLVGSTELSAHLDPEEFRELVAGYDGVVAEAITRFGGQVAKYLGDGVMAYFGWPEAHDNDAERAARAGLAIVEAVGNLSDRNQTSSRFGLSVRVGIDSGIVVVGRGGSSESEVFGDAANIAARIQAAADPNTVVISAAVHRLISGMFTVEARGAHRLKGIAEPVDLFRVVRLSGARSRLAASEMRGLTQFVGREDELRLLMNRWTRACDGEGQVILIIGEAGIGKSRLVRQFRELLAATPHTWNECAGAPYYQNTPFHPIVDMLQEGLAQRGEQSPEAKREELERDLQLAGINPGEAVPLIAPMLNIDLRDKYPPMLLSPEQQRKRLLATLAGWLFGAARSQPVVMAVEDLHWFDASSLELMQLLLEQGATSPLLLLGTARPEFRPPWALRAHHSQLTLNRLSARDVRELVARVLAQKVLSREALEKVLERTGGVPLFVEELTRSVIESGDSKVAATEIPLTLHDSLMARLDRLGSAKEVAQIASVIGGEFSYELLERVASMHEHDLQSSLRRLADAELIYARGIPPDAMYQFKHALIQDAAYEALLKNRRRELHHRVARTIVDGFPAVAEAQPEVLARHWTAAGEAGPAIAAWKSAAEAAAARRAFTEAEEAYRQALAILTMLPESSERDLHELELASALAQVLTFTQGYSASETVQTIARTRALAEKSGNLAQLVVQAFLIWGAVNTEGDFPRGAALADQILDLAQREGSNTSLAFAHAAQMQAHFYGGDPVGAEQHFALFNSYLEGAVGFAQFPGLVVISLSYASLVAWILGHADLARERIDRAIIFAQDRKNPYDFAFGRFFESWLYRWLREPHRVEAAAAQVLAICEKHGFSYCLHLVRHSMGWARAELGGAHEGISTIRQGMRGMAEVGARVSITAFLTCLAEAQARDGSTQEALATINQALQANPGELVYRPDMFTSRGNLRLKLDGTEVAEADFREAITLAQQMSAKTFEIRATTSLARLLRDTNRGDEARAMLSEIYNWFTEGFDTADLKDAKSMLDELAAGS